MKMQRYCFLYLSLFILIGTQAYAQEASDFQIEEVTVVQRKKGKVKSRVDAFDTEKINSEELCRAACCNLSEAFETNASVDVAYSDAATGAKQIRLLGLSGTYVQLIQENTPAVRGLAQNFGLEYIPGPWMQSIQVSKGTSSVINGYEATSGQINVELLKPQTQNPFSLNLMMNSELMAEANIMGGWELKPHLYTGILAHYTGGFMAMDENKMRTSPTDGSTSTVITLFRPLCAGFMTAAEVDKWPIPSIIRTISTSIPGGLRDS